jgi:hypothetical protein
VVSSSSEAWTISRSPSGFSFIHLPPSVDLNVLEVMSKRLAL